MQRTTISRFLLAAAAGAALSIAPMACQPDSRTQTQTVENEGAITPAPADGMAAPGSEYGTTTSTVTPSTGTMAPGAR